METLTKQNQPSLGDPVVALPGVGEYLAQKLDRLGVRTIKDLLELIPRRLEDRSQLRPIKQLMIGEVSVISGQIESVYSHRSKKGVLIVQAKIRDNSGTISAMWFNQRYLLSQLKEGMTLMLYGEKRIVPSLGNPFFVKKIINALEVAPIYPTTAGLHQATISRLITAAKKMIDQFPDIIPETWRAQYQLPSRAKAIYACHFSDDPTAIEQAKKLLAFEELLTLGTQILLAKQERLALNAQPIKIDNDQLKTIVAALPFKLTDGQRQTAWEIIQDLAKSHPMYRLLYGEVGSGKTAVALIAAAAICRSGRQAIWLNPTAILATQQAETLRSIFKPLGLTVATVTGSKKDDYTKADIVVGTHALLEPKIKFPNLGLIIIDEQHRFGVDQRQIILTRYPRTHLLMMSATPIPRSLAQSLFGHLDITYLMDKPPQQQKVSTLIFNEAGREKVEIAIERKIAHGEPGFVICPLINPAESVAQTTLFATERKAVVAEEARLKKRFPKASIGIVHGKVKADMREKIISDFKAGQIDILLSTTVVEVGIDNPRATWILIEEADRFGLAQLHQLRGRVGRGKHEATCYLAESIETELSKKRLAVLSETDDGLKIAEADLALRGPGELIGLEQSGLPSLKYASLSDIAAIKQAFSAATQIIKDGLAAYPVLQQEVLQRKYDQDYQRS